MKGIVLAGGSGTRLYPLTKGVSKQLLPIYDKPMIYYPISVLMIAGIKDILIITTPSDKAAFESLLGDGSSIGVNFHYESQPKPNGLAEAFIIGEKFIGEDDVCLILGDNIFYGHNLQAYLAMAKDNLKSQKASIFGYYVKDPERYGIVEFGSNGEISKIEEKPHDPKSNYAITGLYFFPNSVVNLSKDVKPSKRNELEITSVINEYLNQKTLEVIILRRGYTWLDTGTFDSLAEANEFVKAVENRQGLKIACLEEIAMEKQFISSSQGQRIGESLKKNNYGQYIIERAKEISLRQ